MDRSAVSTVDCTLLLSLLEAVFSQQQRKCAAGRNSRDKRTAGASICVVAAATAEVLLGQPHAALATMSQLDDFDLPLQDGTEVRALAHLAIGDTERALAYIQRLAVRASTVSTRGSRTTPC